jgi:hypothetical protein
MRLLMQNRNWTTSDPALTRMIKWTFADALLGAVCGGLYGLIFGGLGVMLHEPWGVVSTSGYCAVAGAAASALVGIVGGWIEGPDLSVADEVQTSDPLKISVKMKAQALPKPKQVTSSAIAS